MKKLKSALTAVSVPAALYLWAIMPRLPERRKWEPFKGVYYAHRGLHDNASDAPENSLAAFRKAVDAGFGIELDVQLSKDGVPVVFHDAALDRVCGQRGKVCDYTYEQLQQFSLYGSTERIPRFEDVLNLVGGKVPLIVEIKEEGSDTSVCPAADRLLNSYTGVYCIESFNPPVLAWYRRNRNEVLRGQLADGFITEGSYHGLLYFLLEHLMMNWMGRPDFIAYNHKYAGNVSRKLCRNLYKGMAVAWTIKSEEELQAAKDSFDLFIFDSFLPQAELKK